jgi:hypothetical protein
MVRQVKMEYRLKEVTFEPMRAIVWDVLKLKQHGLRLKTRIKGPPFFLRLPNSFLLK